MFVQHTIAAVLINYRKQLRNNILIMLEVTHVMYLLSPKAYSFPKMNTNIHIKQFWVAICKSCTWNN